MDARHLALIDDPTRLAAVTRTGLLDTAPEASFDDLASLAARLLRAPYAFITLVDAERSFWKSRVGLPLDAPTQNLVEESFCQYVIASGQPLIAGDTAANPLTAANPSIVSMGVRAWAGFPLATPDGQVLGSFCVVDSVTRDWTEQDVEVLRVLSGAAGRELALRAAVADATVANAQLTLQSRVGQALTETLDAEEAVSRLARLVVPTLGDWSLVALADGRGELTDVGWWHAREQARPTLDKFAAERLVGLDGAGATISSQQSRRPVVLPGGALQAGLDVLVSEQAKEAYRELNPDVYGVWPLTSGSTVHGVLVIARDAGRPTFTDAETDLAAAVAHRAGTVLHNARLYERQQSVAEELAHAHARLRAASEHDRVVARSLQQAMLTALPEPDHLHVAARYLTADGYDQVGGDWYDALLPPAGATTLMIGDVIGHDITAATIMGQLRNMLRTIAWEHDDEPPSRLIARLDRAASELGVGVLTTLAVARIEQDETAAGAGLRTLRWSTAGHPAPILVDGDGRATLLEARADPPIGIAAGFERHDHVVEVGPGSTVLLYTDGLVETRADELSTRQQQLLDVVASCTGATLDELLDTVLTRMVGDSPDDDVALLAVRFHREDAPRPPEAGPGDPVRPATR